MDLLDLLKAIEAGGKLADYEYSVGDTEKWTNIDHNLGWASGDYRFHIRKKQKTVTCNGWVIPAPEDTVPPRNTTYFFPVITNEDFCDIDVWIHSHRDMMVLNRNILFLSKEDAIMCAKAMLGVDPHF